NSGHFTVRKGAGVEARRLIRVLVEPEADRVLWLHLRMLLVLDHAPTHHLANDFIRHRDVLPPELRVRAPVQTHVAALRPRASTLRLAMVTAPMRRLPILLLMSTGYGESATAARCQSSSDRIRT